MATTTYLTNPKVTLSPPSPATPVDLSDQCTSASIAYTIESLEVTAFGDTGRKYAAGLQNPEVTLTLFLSYGASEVEETLSLCVGKANTLEILAANASPGASNPEYTITGCYLESFTPINGSVGEMSTVDLTFTGGTIARATT